MQLLFTTFFFLISFSPYLHYVLIVLALLTVIKSTIQWKLSKLFVDVIIFSLILFSIPNDKEPYILEAGTV